MTQTQPDYQGNPYRFLESEKRIMKPAGIIAGQPAPRWIQGDVVELGRVFIPPDVSARLVRFEVELRQPQTGPEIIKPTFFGEILDTDLRFFFLVSSSLSPLEKPWVKNVGAVSNSLSGFPAAPFTGVAPFNLYQYSVGDKRELQNAIPLPANTTVFLIARFFQNFVVDVGDPATDRFTNYQDAWLTGRVIVEVGGSEFAQTKKRMLQG